MGNDAEQIAHLNHKLDHVISKLDELLRRQALGLQLGVNMKVTIDDLVNEVDQQTSVEESIVTLLNNIHAKLKTSGINPADQAKLDTVFDKLTANRTKLAEAIVANTDVEPEPTDTGEEPGPTDTDVPPTGDTDTGVGSTGNDTVAGNG